MPSDSQARSAARRCKIVCPHAGPVYPETQLSLSAWWDASEYEHNPTEYCDTSRSDTAYAELIMRLWRQGEGFTVVEADMAFLPEQLDALLDCPCEYGAIPYTWTTNIGPALGMTKFSSALLADIPVPYLSGVSYRQLDVMLMRVTLGRACQRQPHLHLPPVRHLNPAQQLRPEFQHLTLAEHLGALGYEISEDGRTADYVRATREFGEIRVTA